MSKRIAIDLDFTIFNRRTGEVTGKEVINRWHEEGHEITIYTARQDRDYSTVKALLDLAGIKFHRLICGKPHYDLLIDDHATKFEGWDKDYDSLI